MTRLFLLTLALGCLMTAPISANDGSSAKHTDALDFTAETIDGDTVNLHDYEGKVVLIVNVASKCGYTKQYAGLQDLYEKHADQGFVILGFPCNQFGRQEPGTNAEVKQFCTSKFGVTFPMMSKVKVNSAEAADLYKYLTSQSTEPRGKGPIKWNFEKFLIGRDGQIVNRFGSAVKPLDPELVDAVKRSLAEQH